MQPTTTASLLPTLLPHVRLHGKVDEDMLSEFLRQQREAPRGEPLVFELSTLGVQNRLHAELLRMARAAGVTDNRARLDPSPLHEALANRISTHREQVTRELTTLARDGVVAKDGKAMVLRDVDRLARMVADVRGSAG